MMEALIERIANHRGMEAELDLETETVMVLLIVIEAMEAIFEATALHYLASFAA